MAVVPALDLRTVDPAPGRPMTDPAIRSLEAEHSVLGAALFEPDACDEAFERLRPEHFSEGVHQRLWAEILSARRSGRIFDVLAIDGALGSEPNYQELGGRAYLANLVDKAAVWAVGSHVEIVSDRAARRALHTLAAQVRDLAADTSSGPADHILAHLERGAAEIAREGAQKAFSVPAGLNALEMIEDAFAGRFQGASVGLQCLDHVTGGIREDDVWVIAGRASMGKSVAAVVLARALAQAGRGVQFFSLEMPMREVQARLIADLAYDRSIPIGGAQGGNVRYGDLLKGRGTDWQRGRSKDAARALASLPVAVSDQGGLNIDDIRAQAQRQLRAWDRAGVPRGAVIIDHLGLVKPVRRTDNKAADTSDTVNELKGLAKQLKAPIIALAQVNRATESRADKRPTMADLNWSGAIEQIADLICLLYREAYYLDRSPNSDDQLRAHEVRYDLELIVTKNRSGPICTLKAFCDIASNVIRDRDDIHGAFLRA